MRARIWCCCCCCCLLPCCSLCVMRCEEEQNLEQNDARWNDDVTTTTTMNVCAKTLSLVLSSSLFCSLARFALALALALGLCARGVSHLAPARCLALECVVLSSWQGCFSVSLSRSRARTHKLMVIKRHTRKAHTCKAHHPKKPSQNIPRGVCGVVVGRRCY